jgi:carbohydrate-selective porin OprB
LSFVNLSNAEGTEYDMNETTLEVFCRLQIADFVAIAPDVQHIIHPAGSSTATNTLVSTVRFELTFGSGNLPRTSGQ